MVDTRTMWTNVAVREARQEIARVLKKIFDENMDDPDDPPPDYTCGYTNAILDIAREFKMGFYLNPATNEHEIRDELLTEQEVQK